MLTIDKALSIYTDLINSNKKIDIKYFKKNLDSNDFDEFLELIEMIRMVNLIKVTEEFDRMFSKIDNHKQRIHPILNVANFRTDEDQADKEAIEKLDKIFEEEFRDE